MITLVRFIGIRRLTLLGLGAAAGLLLAPTPGRELRAKLKDRLAPAMPLALPPVGYDPSHPPSPS